MCRKMTTDRGRCLLGSIAILAVVGAIVPADLAWASPGEGELSYELQQRLLTPVAKWAQELRKEKNADDVPFKKGSYSRNPRRIDDSTYEVTAHVNTAEADRQVTQRYRLTLGRKSSGDAWEITSEELVDTYVGLYRTTGYTCFPFEKFEFDREGLRLSASNGKACEAYTQGRVSKIALHSADLTFRYDPPAHAQVVPTGHDFYAMHEWVAGQHADQLEFDPVAFAFDCDAETCDRLLEENFSGASRPSEEERVQFEFEESQFEDWIKPWVRKYNRERKKDAFHGFERPDDPGHSWFTAYVFRDMDPDHPESVWLAYDNWDGWEVQFGVWPKRFDVPNQLVGPVYGYYSEETIRNSDPYDLERRESDQTRWFEVYSIDGVVELAADQDSEKVRGDVEFGLTVKQNVKELPFFIISFSERGFRDDPKPIVVNSVEVEGEEVTWVQVGPVAGIVVFPEQVPAGSRVKVRMNWESEALIKFTHSYSFVPRQGWLPFVSFGDVIDEFNLTIHSPAKYDILGVGHKVDERIEGSTRISHWTADSPVNFPTVIFGRYVSDKPRFDAKKLDGTVIPIYVHVDEASFGSWDIRTNALRPIAEQAANSINLYAAISGLDYPFGELNLVNDPLGFLYGQAPSSIIYLGSGVFRGEGALAPYFLDSTGIAKFLRSVVAHEVGHQWWGNTIANANDRNYWFVESLAEYFSAIYLETVYGWKEYEQQVTEWRRNILHSNLKGSVQNASSLFSGEWGGGAAGEVDTYTAAVYNKGPYAFHMLREIFKGPGPRGPDGADQKFYAFLKQFSQDLAEKREIVTLDIQRAAESALGGVDQDGNPYTVDLSWFFDQWIRGSGMPQYSLEYDIRQAEAGDWILEGVIRQRVFLGKTDQVMENTFYRGVVDLTVEAKGGPYVRRFAINGAETPIQLKIPAKPVEVALNEHGEMLALDTMYNQGW